MGDQIFETSAENGYGMDKDESNFNLFQKERKSVCGSLTGN